MASKKWIAQLTARRLGFLLEADEVVHENDIEKIRAICEKALNNPEGEKQNSPLIIISFLGQ